MNSEVARKGLLISPEKGRPSFVISSAWQEHAPFAFWLVQALRPACIVELGTHGGFAYLTLLEAVQRSGIVASGFAVDTWDGEDEEGVRGEHVHARLKAYHDPRYGHFSQLVRSAFDEAARRFADGWIDLLHIDGRRRYEEVRHDFETWRPKLSPRAVVLFHNTTVMREGFGVHRFWKEVRQGLPSFEFIQANGLGVLGVGRQLPKALADLFEAGKSSRQREEVRAHYARLGAEVTKRYRDAASKDRPLPWNE